MGERTGFEDQGGYGSATPGPVAPRPGPEPPRRPLPTPVVALVWVVVVGAGVVVENFGVALQTGQLGTLGRGPLGNLTLISYQGGSLHVVVAASLLAGVLSRDTRPVVRALSAVVPAALLCAGWSLVGGVVFLSTTSQLSARPVLDLLAGVVVNVVVAAGVAALAGGLQRRPMARQVLVPLVVVLVVGVLTGLLLTPLRLLAADLPLRVLTVTSGVVGALGYVAVATAVALAVRRHRRPWVPVVAAAVAVLVLTRLLDVLLFGVGAAAGLLVETPAFGLTAQEQVRFFVEQQGAWGLWTVQVVALGVGAGVGVLLRRSRPQASAPGHDGTPTPGGGGGPWSSR